MKSTLISLLAASTLGMAGCAEAQTPNQTVTEAVTVSSPLTAEPAAAVNWDIQSEGSHIKFSALQEGVEFSGGFERFSGDINFDPEAPELGSVEINIPLASVDAGSTDRNSTLPGKVWFSIKKFPEAVFTSSDISKTDEGYLAKGELSLKGKSVKLDLPFSLALDGDQAVMTSQITMDRTEWDIGSDPWNTDEWVSKEVTLDLQVTATRE